MATDKESRIKPASLHDWFIYNHVTGAITWKEVPKYKGWKKTMGAGLPAFNTRERKGYLNGSFMGTYLKAHRVAWAMHYGEWPDEQIDHINKDKSDNRICNLRVVVNDVNCRNQGMSSANTSGWTGVSFCKRMGKWQAKFKKDYINIHVGYFSCPTSAGLAVMKARISMGFSEGHGFNK